MSADTVVADRNGRNDLDDRISPYVAFAFDKQLLPLFQESCEMPRWWVSPYVERRRILPSGSEGTSWEELSRRMSSNLNWDCGRRGPR